MKKIIIALAISLLPCLSFISPVVKKNYKIYFEFRQSTLSYQNKLCADSIISQLQNKALSNGYSVEKPMWVYISPMCMESENKLDKNINRKRYKSIACYLHKKRIKNSPMIFLKGEFLSDDQVFKEFRIEKGIVEFLIE